MVHSLVNLVDAVGRKLAAPIIDPSGRRILPKGRLIAQADVATLDSVGVREAWVLELEPADVAEEMVLEGLLGAFSGFDVQRQSSGQVNLMAPECSALIVNERLEELNRSGVAVVATRRNFTYLRKGERAATLRARPFAADIAALEKVHQLIDEVGVLVTGRRIGAPRVAVCYCDPVNPERARELFFPHVRKRFEPYGLRPWTEMALEDDRRLSAALAGLMRQNAELVLVASTVTPAVPSDALGRTVEAMGGTVESFMAPVEPGSLVMICRIGSMNIVAAPGCLRNARENVLDRLIPPLLAGYRASPTEISRLGDGGLME